MGEIILIGIMITLVLFCILRSHKNNQLPVLTKRAVVRKNTFYFAGYAMFYYAEFILDCGKNKSFHICCKTHKRISKGEFGLLTFQGTRFKNFQGGGSRC